MSLIQVSNHGPLIVATNYWESELAAAGKLFVSVNAGAIRILLPPTLYGALSDMRTARHCVLTRGPADEMVEILFDDLSDRPYVIELSSNSFDMLPAKPPPGREWSVSVWVLRDGRPDKALELMCHWREI